MWNGVVTKFSTKYSRFKAFAKEEGLWNKIEGLWKRMGERWCTKFSTSWGRWRLTVFTAWKLRNTLFLVSVSDQLWGLNEKYGLRRVVALCVIALTEVGLMLDLTWMHLIWEYWRVLIISQIWELIWCKSSEPLMRKSVLENLLAFPPRTAQRASHPSFFRVS